MIKEYHTCSSCEFRFSVPLDEKFSKWECACSKKRQEVNRYGGLTDCPVWKEKVN